MERDPAWNNCGLKEMNMKLRTYGRTALVVSAIALCALSASAPAGAKGIVKGAAKGAAVGHFVGHGHAKAGAMVGAVHGHHHAMKKAAGN